MEQNLYVEQNITDLNSIIEFLEKNITKSKRFFSGKELESELGFHYKYISYLAKMGIEPLFVNFTGHGYTYLPSLKKLKDEKLNEQIMELLVSKKKTILRNQLLVNKEMKYIANEN